MRYEEPGKDESLQRQSALQGERIVLPPMRLIPPMRLAPPMKQIEWREPTTVQSIVSYDTGQTSSGYGEFSGSEVQDPSYGAMVSPQPSLESPSTNFLALPLRLPTTFEGVYLTSGKGSLPNNMIEPPCTSLLTQQRSSPDFRTSVSARYPSYPAMTPQPYTIEQTPFPHAPDLPDACKVGDIPKGTKHKIRRGNLPKKATEKLKAWFMAHLNHPYPTDLEKQDLVIETKLNYDQISSWFINARRRKLPATASKLQDPGSAQSAPSVISSDSPLLGSEQEGSAERQVMMDIDCCAGCQIDGPETGSDSEKQF